MRRSFSLLMLLLALAYTGMVLAMAWNGGPWSVGGWTMTSPWPAIGLGGGAWFVLFWLRLGPAPPRKARRQAVAKLILLAISLAVSLAIAEVGSRLVMQQRKMANALDRLAGFDPTEEQTRGSSMARWVELSQNKNLVYELRPNLDARMGRYRVVSNSVGMRSSREFPLERLPNSVRIVGVGDSGMFGWGVPADRDYMSVLGRRLDERPGEVTFEVMNFSAPGYNTQQEVDLLQHRALAYDPDVAVIGWNLNDLSLPFFMYVNPDHFEWNGSYVYDLLFDRKAFVSKTRPRVRELRRVEEQYVNPEILYGAGMHGVRAALEQLAELKRQHGFEALMFGTIPDDVVAECERLGILVYNTADEIPVDDFTQKHHVHRLHPRQAGHALLAEHLEQALDRAGLLEPRR